MMLGGAVAVCVALLVQSTSGFDSRFTKDLAEGRDDAHAVPFTITDSLYIVYKSNTERDNQLATVIQLWRNALVPYQALSQKVKISFVSGKAVGGSVANQMAVVFKLDGASRLPIDVMEAKTSFHQVIEDMANPTVANDPNWRSLGGGDSGSGSGGKKESTSFTITSLTITITYSSTSQRQDYLNQLLVLWKSALSTYSVSNVKITFVSEKLDSSIKQGGSKWYIITYTISGDSSTEVDQEAAKASFQQLLITKHFSWVFIVGGGDGGDGGDTNGGDSDDSGNGAKFELSYTITITYNNAQERQKYLDQLLALWKTTLVSYKVTNLQIKFGNEKLDSSKSTGGKKVYIVTYTITGTSGAGQPDKDRVKRDFDTALGKAHYSWVIIVSGGGSGGDGGDNNGGGDDISGGDNDNSGGDSLVTDTVGLSYKNSGERDKLLQQLLLIWKQVLTTYNINNLKIIFDKEIPTGGSGGSKTYIVTYHLSGSGGKTINQKDVTNTFKGKLSTAQISGVVSVTVNISGGMSGGGSISGGGSSDGGDFSSITGMMSGKCTCTCTA